MSKDDTVIKVDSSKLSQVNALIALTQDICEATGGDATDAVAMLLCAAAVLVCQAVDDITNADFAEMATQCFDGIEEKAKREARARRQEWAQ